MAVGSACGGIIVFGFLRPGRVIACFPVAVVTFGVTVAVVIFGVTVAVVTFGVTVAD